MAASILSYGIIGLGFLLAGLAFRLLTAEQKKKTPNLSILKSIYVFEAFSVLLVIIGGVSEYVKNEVRWQNIELTSKLDSANSSFQAAQVDNVDLRRKIDEARECGRRLQEAETTNAALSSTIRTNAETIKEIAAKLGAAISTVRGASSNTSDAPRCSSLAFQATTTLVDIDNALQRLPTK